MASRKRLLKHKHKHNTNTKTNKQDRTSHPDGHVRIGRLSTPHDGIIIEYSPFCFHSARTLRRETKLNVSHWNRNKNTSRSSQCNPPLCVRDCCDRLRSSSVEWIALWDRTYEATIDQRLPQPHTIGCMRILINASFDREDCTVGSARKTYDKIECVSYSRDRTGWRWLTHMPWLRSLDHLLSVAI